MVKKINVDLDFNNLDMVSHPLLHLFHSLKTYHLLCLFRFKLDSCQS